jgi:hypothetical protein
MCRQYSVLLLVVGLMLQSCQLSVADRDTENETRYERSSRNPINIEVLPKEIIMFPGNIITVRCSTSSEEKGHDPVRISFFRLLNPYTVMPLSSGDTGVLIQPGVPDDPRSDEEVQLLTLGKFAWHTLSWGKNAFYCKSQAMNGKKNFEFFTVVKEPSPRSMERRRRYSMERRFLDRYGIA